MTVDHRSGIRAGTVPAVDQLAERLLGHGQRLRDVARALSTNETPGSAATMADVERWHGLVELVLDSCPLEIDCWFIREGDYWTIGSAPRLRLRDSRGLEQLALLLADPGRELHVFDLSAGGPTSVPPADALGDRILDAPAREAYAERLEELDGLIAEAVTDEDQGARDAAVTERAWLVEQLSSAYGIGGRARRMPSSAERARQAVTKSVRSAIRRIEDEAPELGRHLDRSVRTGFFCSYDPEPGTAPRWMLESRAQM